MSAEENKTIVKKMLEERNKGNVEAIREMFAPDWVRHIHGGVLDFDKGHGNPGQHSIDDMIAEGDRVLMWGTIVQAGSEKWIGRHWCVLHRFSEGKIAESWDMINIMSEGALSPGILPPLTE